MADCLIQKYFENKIRDEKTDEKQHIKKVPSKETNLFSQYPYIHLPAYFPPGDKTSFHQLSACVVGDIVIGIL